MSYLSKVGCALDISSVLLIKKTRLIQIQIWA